jgi:hypothetical protein
VPVPFEDRRPIFGVGHEPRATLQPGGESTAQGQFEPVNAPDLGQDVLGRSDIVLYHSRSHFLAGRDRAG